MTDLQERTVPSKPLLPILGRGAEPLLDSNEAAKFLGIHPRTLQRMVRRGRFPACRWATLWRFLPSTLAEWIQQKMAS